MRISTDQIFRQSVDAMLERQRDLSYTELQVATGKRILRPSDDPSGAVRILDLKEAEARLAQYQRNADWAKARLDQEETALISIGDLLQRARELNVQGNNETMKASDRTAIAAEIRQLADSFLQLANTRDANGEYIFGGYQSQSAAMSRSVDGSGVATYMYNGDQGQRLVQVGETREVAIGDPGSIFMNLSAAGGGTTNIGEILDTLARTLESDSSSGNTLTDLDTAIEQIMTTRTRVGARMNAIADQKVSNEAFDLAVTEVRSSLEDLDYAEAISRFNQQLTALRASQQAFLRVQNLNLFNFLR